MSASLGERGAIHILSVSLTNAVLVDLQLTGISLAGLDDGVASNLVARIMMVERRIWCFMSPEDS